MLTQTSNLNQKKKEQYQEVTVEQVKAHKSFQHLSDKEAEEMVNAIKEFCIITYEYHKKKLNQYEPED